MTDYGYIKISRKMFDGGDKFWEENRQRTKAEAWIDLIQMANWKDGKRLVGNDTVELQRGEFLASIRYLAHRWRWSEKKVWTYLKMVEKWKRIKKHQETPVGNTYLIMNYDSYQSHGNTLIVEKETPEETVRKQVGNTEETKKIQLSSEEGEVKETLRDSEQDKIKQSEDYKAWCWALEQRVGNKQPWNKGYKNSWEHYLRVIGLEQMLEIIDPLKFKNVEYLLIGADGSRSILAEAHDNALKSKDVQVDPRFAEMASALKNRMAINESDGATT